MHAEWLSVQPVTAAVPSVAPLTGIQETMPLPRKAGFHFLVLVIGALSAFGWFRFASPIAVEVAGVEREVEVRLFGIGTVEAQISARMGFQVAGRIASLQADQEDLVDAGAPLAQLDPAVQETRVRKATVALEQARTALERSKALLARAEVNQRQKAAISQRRLTLVDRGAVSREAADDAISAAEIAASDLAVARIDVEVATRAEQDASANLAIEQALLDKHLLKAPFRLRVISRSKEAGSIVAPGESVFTIIDPATIWERGFFDEAQAGGLALGQKAHVRLRSEPLVNVEAKIVRIDAENDRVTEERGVYVRCLA
jgi:HlyD family secretion protein